MRHDVMVLGAGMVGVCCALHLQRKGLSVALVDRKPPGQETSFGNAGLIQREAVMPYAMPRDLPFLLTALGNQRTDVQYHPGAVLSALGPLGSYFCQSAEARHREIAREYETLIALSLETHADLMRAAGAEDLVAPGGYLAACRSEQTLQEKYRLADQCAASGVEHTKLSADELAQMEPSLKTRFAGAVHWTNVWSVRDPGALVRAYGELFVRQGGTLHTMDATTLEREQAGVWQVRGADGSVLQSPRVVVALGPWSVRLTGRFGYQPPLFAKRGYHMHYAPVPGQELHHWVMDVDTGYLVCPMQRGLRLTTGAELAEMDAPPTPRQLDQAESVARQTFALGERLDEKPWMGSRPCMPDMKPVFGAVPQQDGLWCAFGHGHQGFTLGPVTGELLAALMTGAKPRVDVAPFAPTRF